MTESAVNSSINSKPPTFEREFSAHGAFQRNILSGEVVSHFKTNYSTEKWWKDFNLLQKWHKHPGRGIDERRISLLTERVPWRTRCWESRPILDSQAICSASGIPKCFWSAIINPNINCSTRLIAWTIGVPIIKDGLFVTILSKIAWQKR